MGRIKQKKDKTHRSFKLHGAEYIFPSTSPIDDISLWVHEFTESAIYNADKSTYKPVSMPFNIYGTMETRMCHLLTSLTPLMFSRLNHIPYTDDELWDDLLMSKPIKAKESYEQKRRDKTW